jgi:hypothetical protein
LILCQLARIRFHFSRKKDDVSIGKCIVLTGKMVADGNIVLGDNLTDTTSVLDCQSVIIQHDTPVMAMLLDLERLPEADRFVSNEPTDEMIYVCVGIALIER